MISELEQWCEIDGHSWVTTYTSMGLVLGPKTTRIDKWCSFCNLLETQYWVPVDSGISKIHWPIWPFNL